MRNRSALDLEKVLSKKGFTLNNKDHKYYTLIVDNKITNIKTRISHDGKEYGSKLMSRVKKQLKFKSNKDAENFFDCPMNYEEYIEMLIKQDVQF